MSRVEKKNQFYPQNQALVNGPQAAPAGGAAASTGRSAPGPDSNSARFTDWKGIRIRIDSCTLRTLDLGRFEALALQRFPTYIPTKVLPKPLEAPDHMQLSVGEMLSEAIRNEADYILPVVVPFVSDFLL
jgi:hypothetical protein